MNTGRQRWLIAALAVAVLTLMGSVAAVAAGVGSQTVTSRPAAGYGPPMMGAGGMMGGTGGAMMGGSGPAGSWQTGGRYGLPGDGHAVTTTGAATTRAQAFADELGAGLHAGEVMQFANGYYSELLTASGAGATEVLIDPATGAVSVEYGPAMMWNTRYGMHPTGDVPAQVTPGQAVTDAQAWLDAQHSGLTADDATTFPGYYTLHTVHGVKIVGMMSVNAVTAAIWYHTWHGAFITMTGA
ncbi:hypothetical protein [Paractinoplanes durhamensis]|uniref:Uncharacterized protein n=1 Tax=Paractinoplanes durhamensis TaxID=113563 RepID=A0ABQ3YVN5_9ACTN|nr:hypothetical protein [Actinoplanes durhamensis]GIE01394.1 hypothetical protein Adu01nite_27440 [Actinoplanes durhamensis]